MFHMVEVMGCCLAGFVPIVMISIIRLIANEAILNLGLDSIICRIKIILTGKIAFKLLPIIFLLKVKLPGSQ